MTYKINTESSGHCLKREAIDTLHQIAANVEARAAANQDYEFLVIGPYSEVEPAEGSDRHAMVSSTNHEGMQQFIGVIVSQMVRMGAIESPDEFIAFVKHTMVNAALEKLQERLLEAIATAAGVTEKGKH